MNTKPISQARTADLRGMEAALARASEAARATAKQFNIPIVVEQNGQLVKLAAN
jgi:thiamine pyrophosphate-dependent acetolactate synthase large subunit-like protein